MLILHFSTDLNFPWQVRLLRDGARLNTAQSNGSESHAVNLKGQTALFVIVGLPAQIWITEYSFHSEHQSQAL